MKKTFYLLTCALFTLLVLPAAAQVPSYVPTDGLVGWWPFNGNANDESGNGNDGVVNGAVLTEDRSGNAGKAYFFNGANSFIEVPNNQQINNLSEVSVGYWVNVDQFPQVNVFNGFAGCVTKWFQSPFCDTNSDHFGLWIGADSTFRGGTRLYSGGTPPIITSSQSVAQLHQWYYICLVHDADFGGMLYINGELVSEIQIPGALCSSTNNLYFGCDNILGFLNRFLVGALDDITIYNRPLTEQEIQNLYTGTTPPPCVSLPSNLQQGLVGYWPFCGNANDESGNGNDGVVNGATLTEDRFGNANAAYGFDGVDDQIVTNLTSISGQEYSISCWFNTTATYNQQEKGLIVSRDSPFATNGLFLYYQLGQPNYYFDRSKCYLSETLISGNETINMGNWINYIGVYSDGLLEIFVNGELIASSFNADSLCVNGQFIFGNDPYYELRNFDGSLDDIAIWNRALTPEEVQELYTLDACTFTIYNYETIYDTVTTYVTVTDTLLIDITFTGFEGQPSWLNTVTVFPNPASDHITIDYGNFALMAGYITIITDAAGATVYSSAVNSQQVEIDINAWGAMGVYYMSVYDASGQLVAVRHIVLE